GPKLKGWSHGTPTMPPGVAQKAILVGVSVFLAVQLASQFTNENVSPLPSSVTKQPSLNVTLHCTPFVAHATHMLDPPIVRHDKHCASASDRQIATNPIMATSP